MKLITLLSLLQLSELNQSNAYRVNLDKGKKSVSSKATVEKINDKIKKMGNDSKNKLHNKKVGSSNGNNRISKILTEPKFMDILDSFSSTEK
jgi:hypothetical protein